MALFSVTKNFQKVNWVFDFGHFFLSIFEKSKKVSKKTLAKQGCYENAAETQKVAFIL
jgi:hypothetical protein